MGLVVATSLDDGLGGLSHNVITGKLETSSTGPGARSSWPATSGSPAARSR